MNLHPLRILIPKLMNEKMRIPRNPIWLHIICPIISIITFLSIAVLGGPGDHISSTIVPVNVGVVLDLSSDTADGKTWLNCINMSLLDLYASHGSSYKTRIVLNVRDSRQDKIVAADAG